jgi:hypothetical protein
MSIDDTIRIGGWFQGPTGSGQGGWTAHRFTERIAQPITTAMRAPVPLETELTIVDKGDEWLLIDESADDPVTVMVAQPWDPEFADTEPVSVADAKAARARFSDFVADHPVPYCFSCGVQHDSMQVHAGPLGDGRFAADWKAPDWAAFESDAVDPGVLWAALDCTAAWYVAYSRQERSPVTAQFAVEIGQPLEPDITYSLVSWSGDHPAKWDGRKRHAASAAFAPDGTCVARSVSFWIAINT